MNTFEGVIEDVNKSELVSKNVIKEVIKRIGYEEWQELYDEHSDICTTTGELLILLKSLEVLNESFCL